MMHNTFLMRVQTSVPPVSNKNIPDDIMEEFQSEDGRKQVMGSTQL
jgi:hypothetical protein